MRIYTLPNGNNIDLDTVISVSALFINKNYPQYNCYEIYLSNGTSVGIFENDLPRASFMSSWELV